jgi:ABC-2 type transport system permease protein
MFPLFKAEFLKLRTVRSTYVIVTIAVVITLFLAYFVEGLKGAISADAPNAVDEVILAAFNLTGLFAALLALLQVSYEYRYRTILYTLLGSNRRGKILLAKSAVLVICCVVAAIIVAILSVQAYELSLALRHIPLTHQTTHWHALFLQGAFYCAGYTLYGAILAGLLRNMAGAVATLLLLPTMIETLLSFALKDAAHYLPFTALGQVVELSGKISPGSAIIAVSAYLLAGLSIWWLAFSKRDAE